MKKEIEKKIIENLRKDKEYIYYDYYDLESLPYLASKSENIMDFEDAIFDAYSESEFYIVDNKTKEIMEEYNLDESESENIQELVYNYLDIEYPIKRFLNETIKVNILTTFKEDWNYVFTTDGYLRKLLSSQNCSKYYTTFKRLLDYVTHGKYCKKPEISNYEIDLLANNKNKFIKSLFEEIDNGYKDLPRCLTFIASITIEDYLKLISGEFNKVTLKKDIMCGLFDPYNGAGSLLELDLNNDITINKDNVYRVVIDEKDTRNGRYTVNYVYGLVGSCFRENVVDVK